MTAANTPDGQGKGGLLTRSRCHIAATLQFDQRLDHRRQGIDGGRSRSLPPSTHLANVARR